MEKSNTNEFIGKAIAKYGNKFDYSKVNYQNSKIDVTVVCPIHGDFLITPNEHLSQWHGCKQCSDEKKLVERKEQFLNRVKSLYGDKYDYSNVVYSSVDVEVVIVCQKHGPFLITPHHHIQGHGCKRCGTEKHAIHVISITSNKNAFVQAAEKKHGQRYDYSKVVYRKSREKIIVICKEHGEFLAYPSQHLRGIGCPWCYGNARLTTKLFIDRAKKVHADKYDYGKVRYVNIITKVTITCRKHGDFEASPDIHLRGNGCPKCSNSKGETRVRCFLENNNIKYSPQHRFETCRYKARLPFDFVVEYRGKKYAIEFHGKQHYEPAINFGKKMFSVEAAKQNLIALQHRDKIKRDWCKRNRVPLLVIPYHKQAEIETLITKFIGYDVRRLDFEELTIDSIY